MKKTPRFVFKSRLKRFSRCLDARPRSLDFTRDAGHADDADDADDVDGGDERRQEEADTDSSDGFVDDGACGSGGSVRVVVVVRFVE